MCFRRYNFVRKFPSQNICDDHVTAPISPTISFSVNLIIYAIFDEDLSQDLSAGVVFKQCKTTIKLEFLHSSTR